MHSEGLLFALSVFKSCKLPSCPVLKHSLRFAAGADEFRQAYTFVGERHFDWRQGGLLCEIELNTLKARVIGERVVRPMKKKLVSRKAFEP
jgi:hypothetical protein